MPQETSKLNTALKNLALACLNATLILVFLCVLTFYLAARKLDSISATFAQNLITLTPLTDEVSALNENLVSLKHDFENSQKDLGEHREESSLRLQARLEEIQTNIDLYKDKINGLSDGRTELIDHFVDKVSASIKTGIYEARQCSPSQPLT